MNDKVNDETDDNISNPSTLNRSARAMIVLLVIVSVGGSVLYFANGKRGLNSNLLIKGSLDSKSSSRDSGNGYRLPGDENNGSAYSVLSPSNQEQLSSIPGLVTGQSELSGRVSSLSVSIETLTRSLADFKAEMDTTLYTKFQALDQQSIKSVDMQSELTLLNNNFQGIKDSIDILKKKFAYKAKAVSNPIKKKKNNPPFKLVSVQIWNSKPVAIVSHQKTRIGIGLKEVLAGWSIDSILVSGCIEASQKNRSVELCQ